MVVRIILKGKISRAKNSDKAFNCFEVFRDQGVGDIVISGDYVVKHQDTEFFKRHQ